MHLKKKKNRKDLKKKKKEFQLCLDDPRMNQAKTLMSRQLKQIIKLLTSHLLFNRKRFISND